MNSFAAIEDIESDMLKTITIIGRDVGTADDDDILTMMQRISEMAWYVTRVAEQTDEWSCFGACQEYHDSLREVYGNLNERLMSN